MSYFNIISETNESTVVTEYTPVKKNAKSYQSEAQLEAEFIRMLTEQGYEYLQIHTEEELLRNLRIQLEKLNGCTFSNSEWTRFFSDCIANSNDGIAEKAKKLQEDFVQVLRRDDGTGKNITLIDKKNIHNNFVQVINQYEVSRDEGAKHDNRYDVTILVNGLPMVHIELKRRGVAIREAFNQIDRYQRDSFFAGSGLFEYVQIFVISNGADTKYYSNTTRWNAVHEQTGRKKGKTSNSFEFTSFWADANNRIIPDLVDFTKTFFSKHTILNILTRYCIFTSENMLMVMRPYQITATERILNRIEVATNYKKYGSIEGGGYIWHTTGSGKTLTSFKTARLASQLPGIDKVLFVVDRKDLDYQTMKEYDRFEKGAANSNTSTAILKKQLEDDDARIIITTIQKLSTFISKNKGHAVYQKHIVIIFDECHRSQFGDMHAAIVKNFKKYHMFGFTGTPIFPANAGHVKNPHFATTEQTFGDKLHTYTIVDAINDKNVLPFRVDYVSSMNEEPDIDDKLVHDIDREKPFMDDKRITKVAQYILDHFDQKTYRGDKTYVYNVLTNVKEVASAKNGAVEEIKQKHRVNGFNSIFAVASVPLAKLYYAKFKKLMDDDPTKKLRIATIFSYAANEEVDDSLLDEENPESTAGLDQSSRDFLEMAIKDYNELFNTNYSTDNDGFQSYYKDLSLRMKNKEIDLLIVVNMFLTGFDATTLNTLWVDKNLKYHGLIQAFSRTNRILNKIKTFGNIVCFRRLQKRVEDAIALFGNREAGGVVLLKGFKDYYYGYVDEKGKDKPGYVDMIEELFERFPLSEPAIVGEKNQRDFILLFGAALRMRNLLSSFDDFAGKELISERDLQTYLGRYQDLRDEWKKIKDGDKEDITKDIVFEVELIKQIEINIDYILMLVKKYKDGNCEDKEIVVDIRRAVDASSELRSKKELIETFIANANEMDDVFDDWRAFVKEQKDKEIDSIITEENLKADETKKFVDNAFRDGELKTTGVGIDNLLPPMRRFGGNSNRAEKKQTVIEKLKAFFERYFGIVSEDLDSNKVMRIREKEIRKMKRYCARIPQSSLESYLNSNPELHELYEKKLVVFAEGYFVVADKEYVYFCDGEYHLTKTAMNNLQKCVIETEQDTALPQQQIGDTVYCGIPTNEVVQNNIHISFSGLSIINKLKKLLEDIAEGNTVEKRLDDLFLIEEENELKKQIADTTKSLCDCLTYLMDIRSWDSKAFFENTGLSQDYYSKIKRNGGNNFGLPTILVICLSLRISSELILKILEKAGKGLRGYDKDEEVYSHILSAYPYISVNEFDGLAKSMGARPIYREN